MKPRYESVAYGGMDVHYKSSHVTLRDSGGAGACLHARGS
jgi:hypothetical protein